MSTPLILVDELCKLASEATKELILEVKNGDPRAPMIIPGFLDDDDEPKPGKPPEDETEKAVPFVIVRFLTGEESRDEGKAMVKITAVTYSKHGQGWRDPLNILERIKQSILIKRPLARQFDLQFPIKWEMPEDRPWPYSVGWMITSWKTGRPILTEMEEGSYGETYP
jgi:hypothetical protein